ncbi:MAG: oligoendopeptidase F [Clostridia bacterium]|nr:oligoendopeptidase F [Clostridia bacterium]
MTNYTDRKQIPQSEKWDLTAIYKDQQAFDQDYAKTAELIEQFKSREADFITGSAPFYATLKDAQQIESLLNRLEVYASLFSDLDTGNNEGQILMGRMFKLYNDFGEASSFMQTAMLKVDDLTLQAWNKEEPGLLDYARTIEKARRFREHTLTDESEKLIASMQNAMHSHSRIRSVFANADLSFGKIRDESGKLVTLTDTNYVPFLMGSNRNVRRNAFRTLYRTYDQFGNTFASLLNSYISEKVTMAQVRKYGSSLEESTFYDEVTPEIYHNLIKTVNAHLGSIYDYYTMKQKLLGIPKLHLYDVYTPLVSSSHSHYTYDEAVREVLDALKILGKEYHSTLKQGLTEKHWVDVWPTPGKRGGAYSSGCYGTEPYILLNFTETLDDVSTLAHESGHSMHSYFSHTNNKEQEAYYTIFVAEVASTVNEILFAHYKLRTSSSKEEKLEVLNQLLELYRGTLFRQTMFAEFEEIAHEKVSNGMTLTKDILNADYYALVKKYFGPDVYVDKQIALEWMRIPHFYRFFYVYKYATCISAASSIVKKIETQGDSYINQYLNFLKCGDSRSPLDSLLVAGIDLRKPEVIEDALNDFESILKEFKKSI